MISPHPSRQVELAVVSVFEGLARGTSLLAHKTLSTPLVLHQALLEAAGRLWFVIWCRNGTGVLSAMHCAI